MILIVGGGPRGLAVALQCHLAGLPFTVFDRDPLSTWRQYPEMLMRSPVTFDLVTFLDQEEFSFSHFLGVAAEKNSQEAIERNQDRRRRREFHAYCSSVATRIGFFERVIRERVTKIEREAVWTSRRFEGRVVIAAGLEVHRRTVPLGLDHPSLSEKFRRRNGSVLVLGSGQSAFEAAIRHREADRRVGLFTKYLPRLEWYPVPSFEQWGLESSFSNHFRSLDFAGKREFLFRVREWQPTIMPPTWETAVDALVDEAVFDDWDCLEFFAGSVPDVGLLPLNWSIQRSRLLPRLPNVGPGFQCDDIHFTGTLATSFDGPRQNSFVSAGLTAKEIVDGILQQASH